MLILLLPFLIICIEASIGASASAFWFKNNQNRKFIGIGILLVYFVVAYAGMYIGTLYPGPERNYDMTNVTAHAVRDYVVQPMMFIWFFAPFICALCVGMLFRRPQLTPKWILSIFALSLLLCPLWLLITSI